MGRDGVSVNIREGRRRPDPRHPCASLGGAPLLEPTRGPRSQGHPAATWPPNRADGAHRLGCGGEQRSPPVPGCEGVGRGLPVRTRGHRFAVAAHGPTTVRRVEANASRARLPARLAFGPERRCTPKRADSIRFAVPVLRPVRLCVRVPLTLSVAVVDAPACDNTSTGVAAAFATVNHVGGRGSAGAGDGEAHLPGVPVEAVPDGETVAPAAVGGGVAAQDDDSPAAAARSGGVRVKGEPGGGRSLRPPASCR